MMAAANRPMVSLLVAMRNEERFITKTLESIFAQDYPSELLEVRVYDGDSTDRSWAIAEALCANRPLASVSGNPRITQSAGWNLGIDEAHGEILSIVSAHCELAPDYVSTAVETLQRAGATMVGGRMRAVGVGNVGQAIALATSTPFGVGNGRFHFTDVEEEVDTVFMGFCSRDTYRQLRFDEGMVRGQDGDLSYRLLDQGGTIICNPAIRSLYRNRSTIGSLWKQYFQYGFWKVRAMQKHPRQVRLRQVVPPAFVAVLGGATALAPFALVGRVAAIGLVSSYAVANLAASLYVGRHTPKLLPYLPVVFGVLHVSYGLGHLVGLVRFRDLWRSPTGNPSVE